jgi:hypothetical protein
MGISVGFRIVLKNQLFEKLNRGRGHVPHRLGQAATKIGKIDLAAVGGADPKRSNEPTPEFIAMTEEESTEENQKLGLVRT